jgi:hypothetical protein
MEGVLVEDQKKDTILYAGQLKVNITDWFFVKDKIELEYIGLDDATIKLQRTDSVWNYQFITDYFSGGKKSNNKSNTTLLLSTVDMKRVKVMMLDGWRGKDEIIGFSRLTIDANKLNFSSTRMEINEIKLLEPLYSSRDYTGNRPDSLRPQKKKMLTDEPFNTGNLEVLVKKIILENGTVKVEHESDHPPYDYFDGQHVLFTNISGQLENIALKRDTLFAKLQLATKERSGFEVNELSADFRMHPKGMIFDNLKIVTPRSTLKDHYAMLFDDFNDDMNHYISNVIMEGNFIGSEIDSDDIGFFAPALKTWKKKIKITGKVKGTVENLSAKNFLIEAGNNTILKGNISINGLPDIDKTYIDFKANQLISNYQDITTYFPQARTITTPNLKAIHQINFSGNLTGFVRDFVTAGIIQTNIGSIRSDLNLKFPAGKPTIYSGTVSTNNFNLGLFLNEKNLGVISTDVKIKGQGLEALYRNATLTANVREMYFNGYRYHDFYADGKLIRNSFTGHILSNDPNASLVLDGTISFDRKNPFFNFESDIKHLNLQSVGFARENVTMQGKLSANFSGLTLDKFLGAAKAKDFYIRRAEHEYHFDSVQLSSTVLGENKLLELKSKDINAQVKGKFNISELSNDVQYLLHNYYPAYIPLPHTKPSNDSFSFKLNTRNAEELVNIIDPYMKGLSNAELKGSVDLTRKQLEMNGNIPYFKYKDVEFLNTQLRSTGNKDSLELEVNAKSFTYQDSISFPDINLFVRASHDTSRFRLHTINNPTFRSVDLNADMYTFSDGLKLKFLPGSFDLFEKKWILEKDGELEVHNNVVSASSIKFTQGEKYVLLNTEPSAEGSNNDVTIDVRKINVGDFLPLFLKEPKIEGLSTGRIRITDPFHKPRIETQNLTTEQFRLNDDSIGILKTDFAYDIEKGTAAYKAISDNNNHVFSIEGTYNAKDSSNKQLVAEISVDNTKLDGIRRYLSSIMSEVNGNISGKLKVSGRLQDLKYKGKVHLSDASFKVDYTQCKYHLKDADLLFTDDGIDFGTIILRDTLNNTGILKGKLFHRNFSNFAFDFSLATDRLLVLNTNAKNNNQFYGKVIGKADMNISGPQNDIRMSITGAAVDSSYIYIPTGNTRESGLGKDIIFKQYGREMRPQLGSEATNLNVNLDLTANELTTMYVIIGDVIEAKGNGNLKINAGTTEPLSIRGRYIVSSGEYTYNLQNLIEKPFILSPNSQSYIEWNGDPYDANMQIRAKYTAEKVRFSDLLSNTNISLNDNSLKNYIGDVDIFAIIKGSLEKPDIDFEISFPQNTDINKDPVVNSLLNQLKSDKNELSKQVSMLLVFNQFTALSQEINVNANVWNVGINSISNLVLNEINLQLNKALSKAFKSTDWNFNISNNFYSSFLNPQNGLPDRSQVNLKIARNLINNKLSITFESDFDFRVSQGATGSGSNLQSRDFVFLPNITADYKLTNDGKLRLTLFFRNNLDFISPDKRNRAGIGLSYNEESDIYTRMRKKKKQQKD